MRHIQSLVVCCLLAANILLRTFQTIRQSQHTTTTSRPPQTSLRSSFSTAGAPAAELLKPAHGQAHPGRCSCTRASCLYVRANACTGTCRSPCGCPIYPRRADARGQGPEGPIRAMERRVLLVRRAPQQAPAAPEPPCAQESRPTGIGTMNALTIASKQL
jgi:hypothetical protein